MATVEPQPVGQLYFAISPLFLLILFLYIFVSLEQLGGAAKQLDQYVWWTIFLNSLEQLIEFEATVVDFAANEDASIIFFFSGIHSETAPLTFETIDSKERSPKCGQIVRRFGAVSLFLTRAITS